MATYYLTLILVVLATVTMAVVAKKDRNHGYQRDSGQWDRGKKNKDGRQRGGANNLKTKPNIIFVLTDDQDVVLGSMDAMPKTRRILGAGGATFPNAFVTTPICCPSRSSILTGMYVHNHNVYTNNDNCSSTSWRQTHETRNFGTYLSNAGYRTGYFGKYLNNYEGEHIPPGWTEWMGLIRNTRFYNYTLNFNGELIKHGDSYKDDYLTDLIANDSVAFLKQSKQFFPNRPVAMVLSMPAPHGPEDAAPQYQHMFANNTAHRTTSWNFAPNPDKQWLLQYTGKLEPIHVSFTDMLQQKRLQTLQSVDDAVEKVYRELKSIGELDNTYWVFTSDHGYHIGQYGLVKGKSMPYDFDVRVPFLMRGPDIPAGIEVHNIVLNVDIAPTLLDIAGVAPPAHMDGKSVLELFDEAQKHKNISPQGVMKEKKAWRDTFLIERGKITDKKVKNRERLEANKNEMILSKQYRLQSECDKAEYQPPCNGTQQWVCRRKEDGNLRVFKCRYGRNDENEVSPRSKCQCPPPGGDTANRNRHEKKLQKQFLKTHVNQPKKLKPKFLMRPKSRLRRSVSLGGAANSSTDAPPLADAGPSYILALPQHSVTLDGSGSHDDRGIVAWQWVMVSMPAPVDMVGTRTPLLRLSHLERGHYTFRLTVTDTSGQTDTQTAHVQVKPGRKSVKPDKVPVLSASVPGAGVPGAAPDYQDEVSVGDYDAQGTDTHSGDPPPGPADYDDYSEYYFVDPADHRAGTQPATPAPEADPTADHGKEVMCRVLRAAVVCEEEVYASPGAWRTERDTLDRLIDQLRDQLHRLKDVKKQLRAQKLDNTTLGGPPTEGAWPAATPPPWAHLSPQAPGGGMEGLLDELGGADRACVCDSTPLGVPRPPPVTPPPSLSAREQKRQDRQRRREEKRQDRDILRQQKQLQRQLKRDQRRDQQTTTAADPTRDCNSKNMKCFTQTNDHWKSEPKWESRRGGARHDPMCAKEGLECTRMDDYHWKVPPQWTHGPFCFCPNSNNNTYWCLRTINKTHNHLYCEFITGFISYYDMIRDPHQLRNAVYDLSYATLQEMHTQLEKLKGCRGPRECVVRHRGALEDVQTRPPRAGPPRAGRQDTGQGSGPRRPRGGDHGHSAIWG